VPQLVLFIGATVCGLMVLTPAAGGALPAVLWQPAVAQLVAEVTPVWLFAGFHAVVVWQVEHCSEVVT
jgi:hypothetical protein